MTDMLLETAVERWLRQHNNKRTRRNYQRSLKFFMATCKPKIRLQDVTPEMVEDFVFSLQERTVLYENHPFRPTQSRQLSPYSLANYVRCLRAFFNWCVQRKYLDFNPASVLRLKQPPRSRRSKAIPEAVLVKIFENIEQKPEFFRLRDGLLLTLLASYGPRNGSVVGLRLGSINLAEGWLTLRVKGDRDLDLPLTPEIAEVLQRWLDYRRNLPIDPPHDYVFVTTRTTPGNAYQPLSEAGLQQIIYRLSEQADPDARRWGPHSIRHWRGQSLADARISPQLIQQLLGHSDITITLENYCNQDTDRLHRLVEQFSMVAKA